MLHLQPEIIKVRKYLTNSSNPWSLSGMKTEFGGYGYGSSAASGMRTTASSHLSPYTSLPPIPVKADLLSPPPYSQYAAVSQFGKKDVSI